MGTGGYCPAWLCPPALSQHHCPWWEGAPGHSAEGMGSSPGLTAVVLGTALVGLGGCRYRHEAGHGAGWGQGARLPLTAHSQRAVLTGASLAVHVDGVARLQDGAHVSPGPWGWPPAGPSTAAARPEGCREPAEGQQGNQGEGASGVQGGGFRGGTWGERCQVGGHLHSHCVRAEQEGAPVEHRAGPPRGQAPPYGSPPRPAREVLTPPCPSSEALALRGRPAPHPSWPHLPPQAPRGAPGTLQGERLRSQGGSCGPQPLKVRTHLGAQAVPGHGRKPQIWLGSTDPEGQLALVHLPASSPTRGHIL